MSKEQIDYLFKSIAENLSAKLPDSSLQIANAEGLVLDDLNQLQERNVIKFQAFIKAFPACFPIDCEHPFRVVFYYRKLPVGYVYGGVSHQRQAAELHLLEKRSDAHSDLDHQFLTLAIDFAATYTLYICKQQSMAPYDKIALIGPVEGVLPYYKSCGFTIEANYVNNQSAMVSQRCSSPSPIPLRIELETEKAPQ